MPSTIRTWQPAAFAFLLYALLVAAAWLLHGDLSRLVLAGDEFCRADAVPTGLYVHPDSSGYDAQYYFRLAYDPANWQQDAHGIRIDLPAYRTQRILYPLASWALSGGGQPQRLPLAMLLVNLVSLTALAWLVAVWCQQHGRSPWWGLLVAAYPGFVLSVLRDLPEPLAVTLLVATYLLWVRHQYAWSFVAATCACLAKETSVAGVGVLFLASLLASPRRLPALLAPLAALVCWIGWQLYLQQHFGVLPVRSGDSNIGWPGAGLWGFVLDLASRRDKYAIFYAATLGYVLLIAGLVLWSAIRSPKSLSLATAGIYAVLGVLLTQAVWVEHWAFMRALSEFFCFGLLTLAITAPRLASLAAYAGGMVWLVFAGAALT